MSQRVVNIFDRSGKLNSSMSTADCAKMFGSSIRTIQTVVCNKAFYKGFYLTYQNTFEAFMISRTLKKVKSLVKLQSEKTNATISISSDSFKGKTEYWEDEFEYATRRYDWNERYLPHLKQIEKEFKEMQYEIAQYNKKHNKTST